jgi:MFS transporter, DHA2 family, multidrug resistance protein
MLAKKFDARWLMIFGLASSGVSMRDFSYITSDWSGGELLVPEALRGFPQVFAVAPAVNLGRGSAARSALRSAARSSTPKPISTSI